jgi:uncharacterized protein involved in exopolysaccharide biosynthesis
MVMIKPSLEELKSFSEQAGSAGTNSIRQYISKSKKVNVASTRWFKRTKFHDISISRIFRGGRVSDFGRAWRYLVFFGLGMLSAWIPAIVYVKYGSVKYSSQFSLILPGSGSNSSVNLSEIGQATSSSSSPFSGSGISPTVTYKNLMMSANVTNAAAKKLAVDPSSLSVPTVKLIDETSFISVEMIGRTPEQARNNAKAIQDAFFEQLQILREDELKRREDSTLTPVRKYESTVENVRKKLGELQIKSGLNSIEQYTTIVSANQNLSLKIEEYRGLLAKLENSLASLHLNLGLTPETAAITLKLHSDPEFAALVDFTAKSQAEYAQLAQKYGSNHPLLVDARSKYTGAQRKMISRAEQITKLSSKFLIGKIDFSPAGKRADLLLQLISLKTESSGLKAQIDEMESQQRKTQKYIDSLDPIVSEMETLNRDYKLAEAVFTSTLGRISTAKTDIFASYPMAQVIADAIIPLKPSSPNKAIAYGGAAGATMLMFIAMLLGWIRRPFIDKLLKKSASGSE